MPARAILLAAMLAASPAQAWEFFAPWRMQDSILEAGSAIGWASDWAQTRYITQHCREGLTREANKILGACPTEHAVNQYFTRVIVGNALISYLLPQELRPVWQVGNMMQEFQVYKHNVRYKVEYSFK